jgi:D-serine deaminase-like pyridoxal phosphate-dependent protein
MRKEELVTSALLIDLDPLEKNIRMISEYYKGTKNTGIILTRRAPAADNSEKTVGGRRQGVSMTSLGLAEYYVQSGNDNILVTAQIYGNRKIDKLYRLSKQTNVIVRVDNLENARQLSEVALEKHSAPVIKVAAELYAGRTSFQPIVSDKVRGLSKKCIEVKSTGHLPQTQSFHFRE